MITAVRTCGVFGSLKQVTQSSRRVSDNTRCRIDLSYPKGPFIVAKRQVGVKKGVRRSKQDELIVAVDEAIGFGRGGLED